MEEVCEMEDKIRLEWCLQEMMGPKTTRVIQVGGNLFISKPRYVRNIVVGDIRCLQPTYVKFKSILHDAEACQQYILMVNWYVDKPWTISTPVHICQIICEGFMQKSDRLAWRPLK